MQRAQTAHPGIPRGLANVLSDPDLDSRALQNLFTWATRCKQPNCLFGLWESDGIRGHLQIRHYVSESSLAERSTAVLTIIESCAETI